MSKKFWIIIGILVVIVIAAILISKKTQTPEPNGDGGDSQGSSDDKVKWLINYIGEKNVKGIYLLYVWYRDKSDAEDPFGSAMWDLYTNHKCGGDTSYTFTQSQCTGIRAKGITIDDLTNAYLQVTGE